MRPSPQTWCAYATPNIAGARAHEAGVLTTVIDPKSFLHFYQFHTVRLLCKLARQLQTVYGFLPFLFLYNNLGHLLFAQKLTPTVKTHRVLTQF